jgi:hypothetical protein
MKLLSIDYLRITTMVELLAPWPGGSSLRQNTHDNGRLLHRTSGCEDVPDTRYWTSYDHFMTEYEARVQRAAYFHGLMTRGWQKLTVALSSLARRVSGRIQTAH